MTSTAEIEQVLSIVAQIDTICAQNVPKHLHPGVFFPFLCESAMNKEKRRSALRFYKLMHHLADGDAEIIRQIDFHLAYMYMSCADYELYVACEHAGLRIDWAELNSYSREIIDAALEGNELTMEFIGGDLLKTPACLAGSVQLRRDVYEFMRSLHDDKKINIRPVNGEYSPFIANFVFSAMTYADNDVVEYSELPAEDMGNFYVFACKLLNIED
jgi:hypothetical protein